MANNKIGTFCLHLLQTHVKLTASGTNYSKPPDLFVTSDALLTD
jgi:hypothetical protein